MAGRTLFAKNGFECVNAAPPSFELMVKKLRKAPSPKFKGGWGKRLRAYGSGLVIIRSDQCPCIANCTTGILEACGELGVPAKIVELKSYRQAQNAPSAYGIFNIVYNGKVPNVVVLHQRLGLYDRHLGMPANRVGRHLAFD